VVNLIVRIQFVEQIFYGVYRFKLAASGGFDRFDCFGIYPSPDFLLPNLRTLSRKCYLELTACAE
jgi:hypothetical protein